MIEFKNVSKTYPTSTEEAVHDANFNIKKLRFYCNIKTSLWHFNFTIRRYIFKLFTNYSIYLIHRTIFNNYTPKI